MISKRLLLTNHGIHHSLNNYALDLKIECISKKKLKNVKYDCEL